MCVACGCEVEDQAPEGSEEVGTKGDASPEKEPAAQD